MFNLFDNPGLLTGITIFGLIIWAYRFVLPDEDLR